MNNTVFNIRDFGAKGDGITLDTNAINQAINTASAAGVVLFSFLLVLMLHYRFILKVTFVFTSVLEAHF
ncbi:MAG: hypothetical protein JKY14_06190 [Paraglaciecola sp.]|nr:hypothetical protein [Paraglaciecola sp.]